MKINKIHIFDISIQIMIVSFLVTCISLPPWSFKVHDDGSITGNFKLYIYDDLPVSGYYILKLISEDKNKIVFYVFSESHSTKVIPFKNYEELKRDKTYHLRLIKYDIKPELDFHSGYITSYSIENELIWEEGILYPKAYYSPDIYDHYVRVNNK